MSKKTSGIGNLKSARQKEVSEHPEVAFGQVWRRRFPGKGKLHKKPYVVVMDFGTNIPNHPTGVDVVKIRSWDREQGMIVGTVTYPELETFPERYEYVAVRPVLLYDLIHRKNRYGSSDFFLSVVVEIRTVKGKNGLRHQAKVMGYEPGNPGKYGRASYVNLDDKFLSRWRLVGSLADTKAAAQKLKISS